MNNLLTKGLAGKYLIVKGMIGRAYEVVKKVVCTVNIILSKVNKIVKVDV